MKKIEYELLSNLIKIKDNLNIHDNSLNMSPYALTDLAKVIEIHIEDKLWMAEDTILQ